MFGAGGIIVGGACGDGDAPIMMIVPGTGVGVGVGVANGVAVGVAEGVADGVAEVVGPGVLLVSEFTTIAPPATTGSATSGWVSAASISETECSDVNVLNSVNGWVSNLLTLTI